jgi:hypothetical protein
MSLKGVNAEYTVKKLYEVATGGNEESKTFESMWGYSLSYLGKVDTGRVRIRITKMSASDFLAAFGKNPNDDEYAQEEYSGYSISGYLEKWHKDKGWVQCLDWLGEPDASNYLIEKDLLAMFKAFITGQPSIMLGGDDSPKPYSSKPKSKSSIDFSKYTTVSSNPYVKPKDVKDPNDDDPKSKTENTNSTTRKDDDSDDDLDWI